MFKKYYIEQYKVKMDDSSGQPGQVIEIIEKHYLRLVKSAQGNYYLPVWTKDYKISNTFSLLRGMYHILGLKKASKDKTRQFALVSEQDVKFIELVTNNR